MPKNTQLVDRDPERRWVSPIEAANYLRVSLRTIRQMAADGRIIPYRSATRIVRYDLNELDAALIPSDGAT